MKKTLLIALQLFFVVQIASGQDFITTWNTFNLQPVNGLAFQAETNGVVSYTWQTVPPTAASGSGTFTSGLVIINGLPGNVNIRLSIAPQNFRRFNISSSSASVLLDINQWGSVPWTSFANAFDASILFFSNGLQQISATDVPNLSGVTNLSNMFTKNTSLNGPFNINFWNVSTITNMSGMFSDCIFFNQALSQWNTSNVVNMSNMFKEASVFNQNIGAWNTGNVSNMSGMFDGARSFNRIIGTWNTINVTNMSRMFASSPFSGFPYLFNQNIGGWNTGSVTNMSEMFANTTNFNQNIGNWNTTNLVNASGMFENARAFNQNIGNWNTANVTNMSRMFFNDISQGVLNYAFANGGSPTIQNWNTANVVNMSGMFAAANNFNYNLGNWALNPAVNLTTMLDDCGISCANYSQTLISWNANPNTPNNKILGAALVQYGSQALPAINNLVQAKGWGFSGHDIVINTPIFTIQSSICPNATPPVLVTTSNNGITGTWSPATINNQNSGSYTFTPTVGQCAEPFVLNTTVANSTPPTFNIPSTLCQNATPVQLPTTALNGITGSWSPAIINNQVTRNYVFTPTAGQCSTPFFLNVAVSPIRTPTFNIQTSICPNATAPILNTTSLNGITGTWLPATVSNQTSGNYIFTPSAGQCATIFDINIFVNPATAPLFTLSNTVCQGLNAPVLPTTSNNGIVGTWSPTVINNQSAGSYTFTPTTGQCATSFVLNVTITPTTTPNFAARAPICSGSTLAALPTISTNGISGTWSPALNNVATTTYTFTPTAGQCATTQTISITVNPIITPAFASINPICSGGTLSALPTTSTNGITGTWAPALNNLATTTYTFTPTAGQCATTQTLSITVNPIITPAFASVNPICSGATLAALPTISTNGISGTWAPALNNVATTTYTFTPTTSQCATTQTLSIMVNQIASPTGNSNQTLGNNSTIANITISPANVLWYSTLTNANANTNQLASNVVLVNGSTYFAVNDNGQCRSQPFAVTVSISLGINSFDLNGLKLYPNPVTDILQISYNQSITSVEIYSILGQMLISAKPNSNIFSINVSDLPQALYLVKIKSDNQIGELKFLKQ